uniref:Uncharacterized protein n=1 Tax=Anguilla anguilla TaxID=7936 RepID=A0A0E9S1T3_ANGAN
MLTLRNLLSIAVSLLNSFLAVKMDNSKDKNYKIDTTSPVCNFN